MSDRSAWDLQPEDEVAPGRRVIELLGGGLREEVYLATDDRLRTAVVVKVLRPERRSEDDRAAMQAEADLLSRLVHPTFPRLLDHGAGERPYLVLEHIEGPRLSTLLRRHGRLALEQVVPLIVDLAGGLHFLHAEGWVHLDVKPGNIVMSARPHLIDLGLARTVEAAGALRGVVGTRRYLAPEQIDPAACGGVTTAADVWALGVVGRETLLGRYPFDAPDAKYPQVEVDVEPLPRGTPDALREVLDAALRRAPAERPTAADVADGLETLVDALPQRPVLHRLRPKFSRRPGR